ncbi:MAG: amidohydrolase, partial [Planctomycetaceae bacterium]
MFPTDFSRRFSTGVTLFLSLWIGSASGLFAQVNEATAEDNEPLFHDSHFHLSNYVHEGISTRRMLEVMGDKVGRVALFGIPLTQKWDYFLNGKRRPGYYLESTSEMYYYSF